MAKKYEIPEEKPCMVSDAVVAYSSTNELKSHAIVKDITMPCTFTDEEFKEELLLSEASDFVSNEDFKRSCLEKWGVAL